MLQVTATPGIGVPSCVTTTRSESISLFVTVLVCALPLGVALARVRLGPLPPPPPPPHDRIPLVTRRTSAKRYAGRNMAASGTNFGRMGEAAPERGRIMHTAPAGSPT